MNMNVMKTDFKLFTLDISENQLNMAGMNKSLDKYRRVSLSIFKDLHVDSSQGGKNERNMKANYIMYGRYQIKYSKETFINFFK